MIIQSIYTISSLKFNKKEIKSKDIELDIELGTISENKELETI